MTYKEQQEQAVKLIDELSQETYGYKRYGVTIGIHSGARTGKTLTAVMLTLWYLENISDIKGVLSNVIFKNLDKVGMDNKYRPLKDLKKLADYKSWIILTDEFRDIIDSRMGTSFKNIFISNILRDTGKFRQIHILTDQDANSIDRRIRVNTDAVLSPRINLREGYCRVYMFPNYDSYYTARGYGMIEESPNFFDYEIQPFFKFFDTEQKIDIYKLRFEPSEYCEMFDEWLTESNYLNHPDFMITNATLKLWKEEKDIEITSSQLSALREYIKYNRDYPIYGKSKQ